VGDKRLAINNKMKSKVTIWTVCLGLLFVSLASAKSSHAFLYSNSGFKNSDFNAQNMLQNAWFKGSDCKPSGAGWQNPGSWGFTDKEQDPTDSSCPSSTGFAARKADTENAVSNSLLWQVVGPVSSSNKTLHFHALIVAHRVNQYKAEIFGGNSPNGPWTSVWVPFNIQSCLTNDCVNAPYNGCCLPDRQCLWELVTADHLHNLNPGCNEPPLYPLTKNISQGYSYYKIQFLMSYPPSNGVGAGDNGGKLARVFFKVSGGGGIPSPTPTPSSPTFKKGDVNHDGSVNIQDLLKVLSNLGKSSSTVSTYFDPKFDGKINIWDAAYVIHDWAK
jgi:hypothetical protein